MNKDKIKKPHQPIKEQNKNLKNSDLDKVSGGLNECVDGIEPGIFPAYQKRRGTATGTDLYDIDNGPAVDPRRD